MAYYISISWPNLPWPISIPRAVSFDTGNLWVVCTDRCRHYHGVIQAEGACEYRPWIDSNASHHPRTSPKCCYNRQDSVIQVGTRLALWSALSSFSKLVILSFVPDPYISTWEQHHPRLFLPSGSTYREILVLMERKRRIVLRERQDGCHRTSHMSIMF